MYKLLALDLDGTLINSDSEIPENNKKAIKKAVDKGVKVCLCSGRSFLSLHHFEKQLGLDAPGNFGICFNGSVIYETNTHKILRDIRLDNKSALGIIGELQKFDADVVVYVVEMLYITKLTERTKQYIERSRIPHKIIDSFNEITSDVSKVIIRGDYESLLKAHEHMIEYINGKFNCFFTERSLLEFTRLDANKGAALKELAKSLGIKKEEVIAVGDNFNDVPMIKEAGLGIAVANAEREAKEAAAYVTTANNNEGAIEEVVDKFL